MSSRSIDNAIFHVASWLEVPVLLLALLALAVVVFEVGGFAVELSRRRRRRFSRLAASVEGACRALAEGDRPGAARAARLAASSSAMGDVAEAIALDAQTPGGEHRVNKALADFNLEREGRLQRTRLLVRAGPALGLMGTLIPLSPALSGLAQGNVHQLTQNLRVAFSVTVLGLLVGALSFGLSLYRDRMYGQDLSDLEFLAAELSASAEQQEVGA